MGKIETKPKRSRGRIPLSPNGERMQCRSIRMTDAEWEKCRIKGGGEWLRTVINTDTERLRAGLAAANEKLAATSAGTDELEAIRIQLDRARIEAEQSTAQEQERIQRLQEQHRRSLQEQQAEAERLASTIQVQAAEIDDLRAQIRAANEQPPQQIDSGSETIELNAIFDDLSPPEAITPPARRTNRAKAAKKPMPHPPSNELWWNEQIGKPGFWIMIAGLFILVVSVSASHPISF